MHSWRGGSVFPSQPRCTTAAMPKADASWSGLAAQCQYLGNSILQSAGVKQPWRSHYLWNPLNEVFLQVLHSLLLLLSPSVVPVSNWDHSKNDHLVSFRQMDPHAGSLNPSLLIVCILKTNVSQGRYWCLALAQNAKKTADWFLTNSFKRRKANSVFNVSLL